MESQDVEQFARRKRWRGARISRHWLLLALIVLGAGAIGLLAAAWMQ